MASYNINPSNFKDFAGQIASGGNTFTASAGVYVFSGKITVGANTKIIGPTLTIPTDQSQIPLPDSASMAIFVAGPYTNPVATKVNSYTSGFVVNSSGVTLSNLYLRGYVGITYNGATGCTTENVIVDHRTGTITSDYRSGWCWFQQTGAIQQNINCQNNTFTNCIARGQHHGFMNQGNPQGWIRHITYTNCRAIQCGCGKEQDGTGRADWSCGFDIAEEVSVDDIELKNCYACECGKVGFYTEPEVTGLASSEGGSLFLRSNIRVIGCVGVNNGKYGGGFRNGGGQYGKMLCKEGEQSNFYMGGGWTLNGCTSIGGSKAGYYSRMEHGTAPVFTNCVDINSNIGFLLELAGAGATYIGCTSWEPVLTGFQVMGNNPIKIDQCKIQVKNGAAAFGLGGYFRVYAADSWDSSNQSSTASAVANMGYSASKLSITNCQVAGTPIYKTHANGQSTAMDVTAIDYFAKPPTPEIGVTPTPLPPEATHNCNEEYCDGSSRMRWDCELQEYVHEPTRDHLCNSAYCSTVGEYSCRGSSIQYVCGSDHLWKSLNKPCTSGTNKPAVNGLNKSTATRINAKNYDKDGYYDTDPANQGGAYRTTEGVDLATWTRGTDAGSTVIGYTANTEWVQYTVNVADLGSYSIKFRTSTPNEGCAIKVFVNGETTDVDFNIPNTKDYATFVDTVEFQIPDFTKSPSVIKLLFTGDFNLNWFELKYVGGTDTDNPSPNPKDIQYEFEGKITINGVDYDVGGEGKGYHKEDPETKDNNRGDPIETVSAHGDQVSAIVGNTGDWFVYTLNVIDSEAYNIDIWAGSTDSTSKLKLTYGDTILCDITIGNTGDIEKFTIKNVYLTADHTYTLKVHTTGRIMFGYMEFYGYQRNSGTVMPYNGKPFKFPVYSNDGILTIQAEYYDKGDNTIAYSDNTVQNVTNEIIRDKTSVDIYTNKDYTLTAIDWTGKDEWLSYSINIPHIYEVDPPATPEQDSERIYSITELGTTLAYCTPKKLTIGESDYDIEQPDGGAIPYLLLGKNNTAVAFDPIHLITDTTDPLESMIDDPVDDTYVCSFRDNESNIHRLYSSRIVDNNGIEHMLSLPSGVGVLCACCSAASYLIGTDAGIYDYLAKKFVTRTVVRQIQYLHNDIVIGLAGNHIYRDGTLTTLGNGYIHGLCYNQKTNTIAVMVNDADTVYIYYSRNNGEYGSWQVINTEQTGAGTAFCVTDDCKIYVGFEKIVGGIKSWNMESYTLPSLDVTAVATSTGTNSILYTTDGDEWNVGTTGLFTEAYGVDYNGSMWCAVGTGSYPIATSLDGKTWTGVTVSGFTVGYDVLWNGDLWIVIGNGSIAYSKDGANWLTKTGVSGWGIATDGPTTIVAGTDGVYKSSDNVNWTSISAISGGYAVANNGSRWIIGGKDGHGLWYSDNKINWIDLGNSIFTACYNIACNGHQWVAVGDGNYKIAYSSDGIEWHGVVSDLTAGYGIVWTGHMWIATGISDSEKIYYSSDGVIWIPVASNNITNVVVNRVACINETYGGVYWNSHILPNIVAVGNGINNSIGKSFGGKKWTGLGKNIFVEGNDVLFNGSEYIAVGSGPNSVALSEDGLNWEGMGVGLMKIGWGIAYNGSATVIVGYDDINTIVHSTDGDTWSSNGKTIFDSTGYAVTWDGTVFIAVGSGSTNSLAVSSDGASWTGKGKTYLDIGFGVATNIDKTIIGGIGSSQMYSSIDNGETWTATGNGLFDKVNNLACHDTVWIAVGHGKNSIAISTDNGVTWTGKGNDVFATGNTILWNGNMWVAGGEGPYNSIAVSPDGVTWTGLGKSVFENVNAVCSKTETFRGNIWNTPTVMHYVTTNSATGGSIWPSGVIPVEHGDDITFSLSPDSNYITNGIKIDNGAITTNYTLSNIVVDHMITPVFEKTKYNFNTTVVGNGAIYTTAVNNKVNVGDMPTITFYPDPGYMVLSVSINGNSVLLSANTNYYTLPAVHEDITAIITFDILTTKYKINVTQPLHGTIFPSGSVSVASGNSQTFTLTPSAGCELYCFTLDGVSTVTTNQSLQLMNVNSDHTLTATFDQNIYIITANSFANGTVTMNGASIASGGTLAIPGGNAPTLAFAPASGYQIESVTINGSVVTLTNGSYILPPVVSNITMSVTFALIAVIMHTLSVFSGTGGVISPSSTFDIADGSDQVFTVTPNTGYHNNGIYVDDIPVTYGSSYTLENITSNHRIDAYFATNVYDIAVTCGDNGTVTMSGNSGSGDNIVYLDAPTYTFHPASGYGIGTVTVDGSIVNLNGNSYYTFSPISTNHTIAVTFVVSEVYYTITSSSASNGTITPLGTSSVLSGSNLTYTFTPNTNYVCHIYVDDVEVSTGNTYTFTGISGNHTIRPVFIIPTYRYHVTYDKPLWTEIDTQLSVGSTPTITINKSSGYVTDYITVNGSRVDVTNSTYTFPATSGVIEAYVHTITYVPPTHTVTLTQTSNGTISASAATVADGGSVTFTVTPNTGYYVYSNYVFVNSSVYSLSNGQFTMTNVTENITATAYFMIYTYNYSITYSGIGGTATSSIPNGTVNYGTTGTISVTLQPGGSVSTLYINGGTVNYAWFFEDAVPGVPESVDVTVTNNMTYVFTFIRSN